MSLTFMEHAVYSVGVTTYRDLVGELGSNYRHFFLPARWKQEQGHKSQFEQAPPIRELEHAISVIRTLDERPSMFIRDKSIFLSQRMLPQGLS
jgi:hypothetical protein